MKPQSMVFHPLHPDPISTWAKVPARAVDGMARHAAMEATFNGLSRPKRLLPTTVESGKNASRAVHRMIGRFGMKWKIPISYLEYKYGSQSLSLPYLSPLEIYKFLIDKAPEILFGGFTEQKDIQCLLKSFWQEYKNLHPGHVLFQQNGVESACWNLTVPIVWYGDEGRGRRRGNTAVVMLETVFGLGTAGECRKKRHCFNGCTCKPDERLLHKYPCSDAQPGDANYAACATTNFKEHVALSRIPVFVLPCSLYKEHPDLIQFMLRHVSLELRQLYHEGITINGRTWTIALLGMKGDSKWLAEIGGLERYYGKKGRKRSLAMCHECYAGLSRFPYEDVSENAAWKRTLALSQYPSIYGNRKGSLEET